MERAAYLLNLCVLLTLSGKICEGAGVGAGRLDSSIHIKLHVIQFLSLVKG
jgi:hypothetical protein